MDTKALRQKILDLAIHGKLVPQDPNDEPASVLLERIRTEKERLIKEGKIKKGKKSAKTSDKPHYPFELPKGWKWCKLGDIAYVGTGATPLTTCKYYYENGNIAWINSSSTKVPFIAKASNFITRKAIEETNCLVYPKGTLVIAMYGEGKTRGQISELLIDAATNQACAAVCPYFEATKEYLKLFFEGNYLHIRALAEGGNQPNLSLGKIQNYEIPLPPLDEQKRILEQAKKLLLQVENIEKEKEKNKNSIKQAKAKILNLAIHGKLVPHDLNDEPASELLRRINPKAEIISDNGHYQQLPSGWAIASMQTLCSLTDGKKQNGIERTNLDVKYLRGEREAKTLNFGKYVAADSLLILVDGENSGEVFRTPIEGYQGGTFKQLAINENMNADFVLQVIKLHRKILRENKVGSAIPHLNKKLFKSIDVPIPPYKEQKRIVNAINETFTILDAIIEDL